MQKQHRPYHSCEIDEASDVPQVQGCSMKIHTSGCYKNIYHAILAQIPQDLSGPSGHHVGSETQENLASRLFPPFWVCYLWWAVLWHGIITHSPRDLQRSRQVHLQ
jgi:hypothetical protein